MKIDKSLQSGSTSMLLLELLSQGDMYGYQMIAELERRSNNVFSLKAGTLYPLLHSLEQDGCVEAYDGPPEKNRPRRYYHITKHGLDQLHAKKEEWSAFVKTVGNVIGGIHYAV